MADNPRTTKRLWLADLSIRQPVFITMVVLAMLVTGGLFWSRMAVDLLPDVSLPIVVVTTTYPGADPQEVERSVTKPIEDEVASLNGVDNLRSTSMDSFSMVIVEFTMETDAKTASDDVRTRVNSIRNSLPADVQDPVIDRFDISAASMMTIAVSDTAGASSPEQLRDLVDDVVKPRLERVPGVASLEVTGGKVREVHVDLRAERLKAYGVPPQQVIQAIRAENLDVPGGRVPGGSMEELLRTSGRVQSLEQMGEIPVSTSRGTSVKLKEMADLSLDYAEVRTISRLNGKDSVVAEIRKQSGTNVVRVAEEVRAEIDRLQKQHPNLTIAISRDQSTFTRESVHDAELALLLGGILAALVVLLFFRDIRNTLVTVAGLPVVVFGTFGVLYAMGITLNIVTLMALSISIGMLIDDAIVVRENIFRHMEHGREPREASSAGTAEIALAVMAVTFTIVAVFLPIAFTGGVTGKFLREFGITVVVAVLISLIEAFTFAPMLSAYFSHRIPTGQPGGEGRFVNAMELLNSGYRRTLEWSLGHRGSVVLLALASLAATLAILPMMSRSFLPVVDRGEFGILLEMPPGTRLEDTDKMAREAERVLLADPEVQQAFSNVGETATQRFVDRAIIQVRLKKLGGTDRAMERLRLLLREALPGTRLRLEKQATTAAFGLSAPFGSLRASPIQFSVEGPDLAQLDQVSRALVERLSSEPGLSDVDRSLKPGRPERVITVDRNRASDLSVSTGQVGSTIRVLVSGEKAGSFRGPDKDLDIVVRMAERDRNSPEQILQIPVITGRGVQLPLSSVANVQVSTEPNQIERQDRQRQVLVGAAFTGRDLGGVLERARAAAAEIPVPEGTAIRLAGDAEYMDDAFGQLYLAVALSLLFVYMILASQFASFIHPFTIMLALPFSIVGAMGALLVSRFSLDMLGMIGVMLLMGLVAKNSILLVEFANQLKRQGLSTREAVLRAGPVRLRPILMTTLAMIFGMAPAAAGLGAGAELRQPMGISVVGGLITSTLLTLVVVPVAYSMIDDLGNWLRGRPRAGGSQKPHLSGNGSRGTRQGKGLVVDSTRAPLGAPAPVRKGKELD